MGVDYENKSTDKGRNAVRVESKAVYNLGLFIFDLDHVPESICGLWPALWMLSRLV